MDMNIENYNLEKSTNHSSFVNNLTKRIFFYYIECFISETTNQFYQR